MYDVVPKQNDHDDKQRFVAAAIHVDPTVIRRYQSGFVECSAEVKRYLSTIDCINGDVKTRLVQHLNTCSNGLNDLSTRQALSSATAATVAPPQPLYAAAQVLEIKPLSIKPEIASQSQLPYGISHQQYPVLAPQFRNTSPVDCEQVVGGSSHLQAQHLHHHQQQLQHQRHQQAQATHAFQQQSRDDHVAHQQGHHRSRAASAFRPVFAHQSTPGQHQSTPGQHQSASGQHQSAPGQQQQQTPSRSMLVTPRVSPISTVLSPSLHQQSVLADLDMSSPSFQQYRRQSRGGGAEATLSSPSLESDSMNSSNETTSTNSELDGRQSDHSHRHHEVHARDVTRQVRWGRHCRTPGLDTRAVSTSVTQAASKVKSTTLFSHSTPKNSAKINANEVRCENRDILKDVNKDLSDSNNKENCPQFHLHGSVNDLARQADHDHMWRPW